MLATVFNYSHKEDDVHGYDDYTQLEINSKLIQKINEVIENCNNTLCNINQ